MRACILRYIHVYWPARLQLVYRSKSRELSVSQLRTILDGEFKADALPWHVTGDLDMILRKDRSEEWRGFLYAEIVQIPSWLLLPRKSLLSQNISLLQVCRWSPPKYLTLKTTIEKGTRDKAVKNLSAFLSNSPRDALPALEMAKLWKGIFYCPYTLKNLIRSSSNDLNRLLDVRQTIGATGTCERTSRNFANNL